MKTLSDLFVSETLKHISEKAKIIESLNRVWSIAFPEWATECNVAMFEQGELILHVANAAWSTRVRYAAPEILKKLTILEEFKTVKKIRCKVIPINSICQKTINYHHLPSNASLLLEDTANNVKCPELKASLSKLASNIKSYGMK